MDLKDLNKHFLKYKYGVDTYHTLMQKRVREVLLVSTFYDAYIFEQDGGLSEKLFDEYHRLNLTHAARITSVTSGQEALRKIESGGKKYDLVITLLRTGEVGPYELSKKVKAYYKEHYPDHYKDFKIFMLLDVQSDLNLIDKKNPQMKYIDDVFLWKGDSKIFLAMIKYVEDMINAPHDTKCGMTRIILLVEDSIYFYSKYLPILYEEVMNQTNRLAQEESSEHSKNHRMRTRPKVLIAHDYEEAIEIFQKYKEYLLCIISDIRFDKDGEENENAGIELIKYIRSHLSDLPVIVQTSEAENAQKAYELRIRVIKKHQQNLSEQLRQFIHTDLGFGDFVFYDGYGRIIDRAKSMTEFEKKLRTVSIDSILFHSNRNHFSSWLIAHGAIAEARKIRPLSVDNFQNPQKLREFLVDIFRTLRIEKNKGRIADFEGDMTIVDFEAIRLASGSLGGKGRGLAFLNALFGTMDFKKQFPDIEIKIPRTAFIGIDEFDHFIKSNNFSTLNQIAQTSNMSDEEISKIFLNGKLSRDLRWKLKIYIDHMWQRPIAVRSSGLLEDSQAQPFAGIYRTYMLPNNHPDESVRLKQLENAIKLVMASTFMLNARRYIDRIKYKTEEEKMGVIVQEIVGNKYGNHFYPHISGVAQSYNYYPTSYLKNEDGVANLALGLGQWVVGGKPNYRFCPHYPKMNMLTVEDIVQNTQTHFYALNMSIDNSDSNILTEGDEATLDLLPVSTAEEHGTLTHLASVWDPNDGRLRPGIETYGPRVLNFANILNYGYIPLSDVLIEIMDIGSKAFGVPVEIEFAIDLNKGSNLSKLPIFYILQIRPLSVHTQDILLASEKPDEIDKDLLFVYTEHGMGNGRVDNLCDIIYIDPEKFDKTRTEEMRHEIQQLNNKLNFEGREYILIGPGRWGTCDRFLGVPVQWSDINMARVIIEAGIDGFVVDSSQGTHFFHNLVAMNAGYFNIPYKNEKDFIDTKWLEKQPIFDRTEFFVHIRREKPYIVKMYGREGISIIYKD